jgi:ACR3 family arsenite transporter
LRAERFGSELRGKVKETILGLLLIFGLAPLLAIFLAGYIPHKEISIGFVAANAVPASSASIAYVLLAEGNIEFATLLAIISIIGALGAVPAYVGLYAKSIAVNLPIGVLGESVAIALLTPFILGQLTRYYLVKMRARRLLKTPDVELECKKMLHGVLMQSDPPEDIIHKLFQNIEDALECIEGRISKSIKPYLSLMTMISMLILISLLIANKAFLLISKPVLAGSIIGMQLVIYAIIISTTILASKALKLSYEDHMGTIFIALTKNESVAAAVSVLAIGAAAAVPAALVPAIQPVIAILYLSLAPWLRRYLGEKT